MHNLLHLIGFSLFACGLSMVSMLVQSSGTVSDRARLALLKVFFEHKLDPKVVAAILGYTNSQWQKIARGEKYYRLPPVDRLMECLPVEVLMDYLPELGKITLERYLDEGAADAAQRRSA